MNSIICQAHLSIVYIKTRLLNAVSIAINQYYFCDLSQNSDKMLIFCYFNVKFSLIFTPFKQVFLEIYQQTPYNSSLIFWFL